MDNTDKIEILNQALENLEGAQTFFTGFGAVSARERGRDGKRAFCYRGHNFSKCERLKKRL